MSLCIYAIIKKTLETELLFQRECMLTILPSRIITPIHTLLRNRTCFSSPLRTLRFVKFKKFCQYENEKQYCFLDMHFFNECITHKTQMERPVHT